MKYLDDLPISIDPEAVDGDASSVDAAIAGKFVLHEEVGARRPPGVRRPMLGEDWWPVERHPGRPSLSGAGVLMWDTELLPLEEKEG